MTASGCITRIAWRPEAKRRAVPVLHRKSVARQVKRVERQGFSVVRQAKRVAREEKKRHQGRAVEAGGRLSHEARPATARGRRHTMGATQPRWMRVSRK